MFWKRLFGTLRLLIISCFIIIVIAPEWPAFQGERHRLNTVLGQRYFDFLVWEVDALAAKIEASLTNGHSFLDRNTRQEIVLEYLAKFGDMRRLEGEINAIYADPEIDDPALTAKENQQDIDLLRAELGRLQPLVESIVQEQVSAVLVDEGFGLLGSAWPPVEMHMTPLPYVLIVSPREEIRQIYNIPIEHGLTVSTRDEIETAVTNMIDRSALVVPIGGLGFYPSMIVETSNINFLADVVAHEWAHHWLTLHPLGLAYAANPQLRTINETVASIVGEEVGRSVIERFYPEYLPPEEAPTPEPDTVESEPPAFDFNAEMAKTRVRVDALLVEERVDEAEAYMEERRQFFWDNGYHLRKLNQAYFAFYGAYATSPGEQGDDPIGPALLGIRENSASLRDFMDWVAAVTSLEKLQEVQLESASSPTNKNE